MTGDDGVSRTFAALAKSRRREILHYFVQEGVETASYDDLTEALLASAAPVADRTTAKIRLHHVDLPVLARCDLVQHDPHDETVQYLGSPLVERNLQVQPGRSQSR